MEIAKKEEELKHFRARVQLLHEKIEKYVVFDLFITILSDMVIMTKDMYCCSLKLFSNLFFNIVDVGIIKRIITKGICNSWFRLLG